MLRNDRVGVCDRSAEDPWAIIELYTESVLNRVLGDVASELLQGCDAIVDTMLDRELLPAVQPAS
eukprot:m.82993 g.82993  ORF g.82993 m.82993 type:complete len:65 (+) comp50799_c2_seq4:505-699(+)